MLDAKEQGAQRPEESTIIPFSESRYRSSDVGRAHLQTGEAHLFISAPSGNIAHYTLLRKVVRQARHLCAQSAALMCLMGTPHTPLYARRTVRITGTWQVPITAQSSTDATDHDALQPLRGSEADCPLAHPSIHPITPATSEQAAGAPRPKRWGGAPFSINEGRPQRASPASLKKKIKKEEYHQTRMVKPFSLNSHRTIYAGYRINCTVTP